MSSSGRICLHCRSLVEDVCDCIAGARTVDPRDPASRAAWLDAVWGPPSRREAVRALARGGGAGGALGGGLQLFGEGCAGCGEALGAAGGELGAVLAFVLVVLAFVAVGALLAWLALKIAHRVRVWRQRLRPAGGPRSAPARPRPFEAVGTVTGGTPAAGCPLADDAALAFSTSVHARDARSKDDVVLRRGACAGLSVALDDGRTVTVPAGAPWIDGPRARRERIDADTLAALIAQAGDALRDGEHALVPAARGSAVVIRKGDRVRVRGTARSVAGDGGGAYRDAQSALLIDGRAYLEIVDA